MVLLGGNSINYHYLIRSIGKCQKWKVSELESVRVGKCLNPSFALFGRKWNIT